MDRFFMDELFDRIKAERGYQDDKWGDDLDDKHTMNDWAVFVNRYVAKVTPQRTGLDDGHIQAFHTNMIKAAAIIFAALEALERNGGMPPRHYD